VIERLEVCFQGP